MKFGAQPEFFTALGPARAPWTVSAGSGLVQDAETTHGGGRTRRRILCAKHEGLYVSLALYIDAKDARRARRGLRPALHVLALRRGRRRAAPARSRTTRILVD